MQCQNGCPNGYKSVGLNAAVLCPKQLKFPLHAPLADDDEKSASNKTRDQRDVVRESFDQARALCTATVSGFVQALANALPQYAANGIGDFSADPWWTSMTSYLKASLWLFAAVPGVPTRYLSDEEDVTGNLFILRADEVEVLASTAGCRAHVEVCVVYFSPSQSSRLSLLSQHVALAERSCGEHVCLTDVPFVLSLLQGIIADLLEMA